MSITAKSLVAVAAFALVAGGSAAQAGDAAGQVGASPDLCIRTIKAMGSSMGYTAREEVGGKAQFLFVLRANGVDYDALCDAATGLVKDVTPRTTHN